MVNPLSGAPDKSFLGDDARLSQVERRSSPIERLVRIGAPDTQKFDLLVDDARASKTESNFGRPAIDAIFSRLFARESQPNTG